jgi:hypothetical protein
MNQFNLGPIAPQRHRFHAAFVVCCLAALFLLAGCGDGQKQKSEGTLASDSAAAAEAENVQKLVYGLPSPTQALSLLKTAGAKYEPKLLNPDGNVSNYQNSTKAALNIGVYSADLAYTSTFDRSSESVKYFMAIQKLADQLGISSVFDEKVIARVDKNKNNQDSIIAIFSSQFVHANKVLKKTGQEEYARLILVGGWIEGLHVATEIYKLTPKPEIGKRIAEQKITLETLIKIAEPSQNNPAFADIFKGLKDLEAAFAPIQMDYSYNAKGPAEPKAEPAKGGKTKKTIRINNASEAKFTQEQIMNVQAKVAALRKSIIS